MFHGVNNSMEGGYIVPSTSGYPFQPQSYGFVQQPPGTISHYPNGPAIVSPVYYLPSISPPLQQINSTPYMSNCFTNNSQTNISESSDTSSSYDKKNFERITSVSENEFTKPNTNTKTNSIDVEKGNTSCQNGSPIDEMSSALLVTDRFAVKLEPNKFIHGVPATKWYTLSDEEREEVLRNQRRVTSYKTALCISYRLKGVCSFGDNCRFAHSLEELKPPPVRHPKYKTQLCDKFSATGICPYGSRCNFIHTTKSGQIVCDYPKYLAALQRGTLDDEDIECDDEEIPFAASMNSIPRKYSFNQKIESNTGKIFMEKPSPQVINFSKSFGAPMLKTLFEKGKLSKNKKNEKYNNQMEGESKCYIDGCDRGSTISSHSKTSSSTYDSISISEKREEVQERSVLDKLFVESRRFSSTNKKFIKKKFMNYNEDLKEEDDNFLPGSMSYTNGYWKKNNFHSRNNGYYSQSKVPTFLKFDNL
ncbi:Cth1 [Strongyloides ratti]|uniref:Cth1 n=1 Tax=Strongyloides ratti TaxID=34506 RepID=A0A090L4G6_STRRB|nr:Cth1 [Strongyloides ratti]CEF62379.1 Cth1 [Strongyloides ratti]